MQKKHRFFKTNTDTLNPKLEKILKAYRKSSLNPY